jgi:LPXTG-site transpeptidase (sortase) family protein
LRSSQETSALNQDTDLDNEMGRRRDFETDRQPTVHAMMRIANQIGSDGGSADARHRNQQGARAAEPTKRQRPWVRGAIVGLAAIAYALILAATSSAAAAGDPPQPDRLIIPHLHLNDQIGTSIDAGPAFYPGSAHPGQPHTIAIAGHRTTHTRPFWSLDRLSRGDRIVIVARRVRHLYVVTGSRIVAPDDWSITKEHGYERVILTTCTPRFSAKYRLVVFALPAGRSG